MNTCQAPGLRGVLNILIMGLMFDCVDLAYVHCSNHADLPYASFDLGFWQPGRPPGTAGAVLSDDRLDFA